MTKTIRLLHATITAVTYVHDARCSKVQPENRKQGFNVGRTLEASSVKDALAVAKADDSCQRDDIAYKACPCLKRLFVQ
jgi:hypothetical protein